MDEIILGNRYELHEEIGSGGMAHVFKARDLLLGRNVAVKVLKPEYIEDAQFVERFRVEAQAAASLSNANIVMIYDVGHDEGIYYIVMEYVDGVTLKEYISGNGKLNWREAVNIAIQITQAIESAHGNNIIHRDIKPHNILITRDKKIKVTDFGIARAVTSSTLTTVGSAIGSVHYFSPEQAKGVHTDEKSDIYSLGITLYEMVTGNVPFEGDTPIAVALKQIQEKPMAPIDANPQVPPGVNAIILRAIEKDRFDRYRSANEMLSDLKTVLKDPIGETLLMRGAGAGFAANGMNARDIAMRDNRDMQDIRDVRDMRDMRDIRDMRDVRDMRDMRDIHDTDDMREDDIVNRQNGRGMPPQRSNHIRNNRDYHDDGRGRRLPSSGQSRRPSGSGQRRAEDKRRNPVYIIIPLIAVIIAIGFMVWLISVLFDIIINPSIGPENESESFSVESYTGKRYSEVRQALSEYDIRAEETRAFHPTYEEGFIISQDVPSGTKLATDGTAVIVFDVSDGPERLFVQNYKNSEYREAEADLRARGMRPEIVDEESSTVEEGHVTRTDPPVGTEIELGARVYVYRSLGRGVNQAAVPQVLGMTYSEAKRAIEESGFVIGITFPDSEIRADDVVTRQSLNANTQADIGVPIDLWFGRPSDDDEPVETPTPTPSEPEETPTPTPSPEQTPTPTPTPDEVATPTPRPEEPGSTLGSYVTKTLTLGLPREREYEDTVRVLVEVTPSDTGLQMRAVNRRIPIANFPYSVEVAVPVGGTTLVTIYYEGEYMEQMTLDDS